jgi:hypothetical protein
VNRQPRNEFDAARVLAGDHPLPALRLADGLALVAEAGQGGRTPRTTRRAPSYYEHAARVRK